MSEKDGQAKKFLEANERFADAFNYFMYDGEQVIRPEDLEERDTTELLTVYGIDLNGNINGKTQQRWRDLLKHAIIKKINGHCYVLFGIENQSEIHYAMVVRNMISDALNYGSQITEIARKHRVCKDTESRAEFLSGFKKDDKLVPVITLTIYWGADEWDGPRSLYDMFRKSDRDEFSKFVSDYKLNLIMPSEIEDFSKFSTELGDVLEIIKASNDKTEMVRVISTNHKFKAVDNEVIGIVKAYTGLNIKANQEGGKTDMCKAAEELERSCEAKGIIGYAFKHGAQEYELINELQETLNIDADKAREYIKEFAQKEG